MHPLTEGGRQVEGWKQTLCWKWLVFNSSGLPPRTAPLYASTKETAHPLNRRAPLGQLELAIWNWKFIVNLLSQEVQK